MVRIISLGADLRESEDDEVEALLDYSKVKFTVVNSKQNHNAKVLTLTLVERQFPDQLVRPVEKEGEAEQLRVDGSRDRQNQRKVTILWDAVTEVLTDPMTTIHGARQVPYFVEGKVRGLRLFGIKEGSIIEKLGFKNGDIVEMGDQAAATNMGFVRSLFREILDHHASYLVISREGKKIAITYVEVK